MLKARTLQYVRAVFVLGPLTLPKWQAKGGQRTGEGQAFLSVGGCTRRDNPVQMVISPGSQALLAFVEEEMLRAPLLFDEVLSAAELTMRQALPQTPSGQRAGHCELMLAMQTHRQRLSDYFVRSLRQQTSDAVANRGQSAPKKARAPGAMALVDEEEVAMEVELSHTIQAIRSTAEYELRELQTFTAALVGDMDVAQDHNPFRAETYARALWASASALPLSRGFQVAYLRQAGTPLAQVLRKAYAASCSRLEAQGVEPAAYRTLILPSGSRRSRSGDTTFSPDLQRKRDSKPLPVESNPVPPLTAPGRVPNAAPEHRHDFNFDTSGPTERQPLELMACLFDAIAADKRVPADVLGLITRLRGPAMRMSLLDSQVLNQDVHPLWRFIDRLAYEAEMAPDIADPERVRLLKVAHTTIEQLAAEPEQSTALYHWAAERLAVFLQQRLARRCSAVASHIGALQKLEDKLCAGQVVNTTMHGTLDVPQLDTVPAALMYEPAPASPVALDEAWLQAFRPGDWLRMFVQGHWQQVQLLWPGERREIWLFGDGASDATFAVRRRALMAMRDARLLKGLTQRSLSRRAAFALQEQVGAA